TSDAREVERMIHDGDDYAAKVYQAMAYQIGKEIGACAAVLKGDVKAIIITGGLAYSSLMTGMIKEYVSFIAPVELMPGELEMKSLYEGARRVLMNEEEPLRYREEILSEKF
ncbi:MAG: butyrate kinase, partial [Clostridia bacterium]|nr:butyrate kinase [Clostridia bacterium]